MADPLIFPAWKEPWQTAMLTGVLDALLSPIHVHLYQNPHVPALTDILANYTESTFAGYAVWAIATGDWSASGPDITGDNAFSQVAPHPFTLTAGAQAVYGFFITTNDDLQLLAAWQDGNAPVNLSLVGFASYVLALAQLLS